MLSLIPFDRLDESVVVIPRPQLPSPAASQSDLSNSTLELSSMHSSPHVSNQRSHLRIVLQNTKMGYLRSQSGGMSKRPSVEPRIRSPDSVSTPCDGYDVLQNICHDVLTEDLPTGFPNITQTEPNSVSQSHPLPSPMNQTPASANVPEFSFDLPSPATCYRPMSMSSTDFDLLDTMSMYAQSETAPTNAGKGLFFIQKCHRLIHHLQTFPARLCLEIQSTRCLLSCKTWHKYPSKTWHVPIKSFFLTTLPQRHSSPLGSTLALILLFSLLGEYMDYPPTSPILYKTLQLL